MPRIDAPTVAEHHQRQQRALLDAAKALLAETGEAPSMAAVGRRAGLARSSVYQYFESPQALLHAVVADVLPAWAAQVHALVAAADTPGERVWAYIAGNVDLFASAEQVVAHALARVVDPQDLRGPMQEFHAALQVPLREALADLGEPDVVSMAELIDSIIVQASRADASGAICVTGDVSPEATLARLRRLLGGYLGIA
ncbi:TetR/AcrR family transcriptional regulator [Nocardioides sp. GXZ039]|uniref:TetR/AcrR family transcriptional regulator n=1 Tax=Nocardioides sp. GXZ039 TaxID=3136018 RepID=UPI0030F3B2AC